MKKVNKRNCVDIGEVQHKTLAVDAGSGSVVQPGPQKEPQKANISRYKKME